MPPDRAGVHTIGHFVSIVSDGRYYAYSYGKNMSTLYASRAPAEGRVSIERHGSAETIVGGSDAINQK